MISLQTPVGDCELLELLGEEDDPSLPVESSDSAGLLLARLRPMERAMLLAHYGDGLSTTEIAGRLGISPLAVTRRLRRAERRVRGRTRRAGVPAPLAGRECSVGTIRVRKASGKPPFRVIKVRMEGSQNERWRPYARVLWEQHKGPIPPGWDVLHKNGETLDDRLENLVLGGDADRAFLAQERLRRLGRDPFRNVRLGCAAHNRERAAARLLRGELCKWYWYLIDHDARTIIGHWGKRTHPLVTLGWSRPRASATCSKAWVPLSLGWPEQTFFASLVLHALSLQAGGLSSQLLLAAVCHWADRMGHEFRQMPQPGTLASNLVALRRAGFVASSRGGAGRGQSTHRILPAALAARGPVETRAAMRGKDAVKLRDRGYQVQPPPFHMPEFTKAQQVKE